MKTVHLNLLRPWLFLGVVFLIVSCKPGSGERAALSPSLNVAMESPPSDQALIQRGKYLVTISGCNDCHSPKLFNDHGFELDPARLLSGHPSNLEFGDYDPNLLGGKALFNEHFTAVAGPWGISYAGNLTPDPTGIGNWSLENFSRAIREGKFKGLEGGRDLLPPMPWENFAAMTDEDVEAIFAYLNTLKPVRNVVPAPKPPFGS